MSENIKPWKARLRLWPTEAEMTQAMEAEIAELRAALEMAQAPSAPVAAETPVAALLYMDELPAAQAGEAWIAQFAKEADKVMYSPDEGNQAIRVKWCAYFDSYDRLVAAYLLTRDAKNWTQLSRVRGEPFAPRAALSVKAEPSAVEKMLATNELDELGEEVARLQRALCFWLPSVTEREDEVAARILEDAFLLVGIDGNIPDDFKTAQELGWVTLAAAPTPPTTGEA